jgi:hypothetical protein
MKYKTKCPSCDADIGIVTIIMALTPFTFKCGKCKSRIYIKGVFKLVMLNLVLMGALSIIAMRVLHDMGIYDTQQYLFFLIPVFIIIALEVIRCLIVCNKAKLQLKKKK